MSPEVEKEVSVLFPIEKFPGSKMAIKTIPIYMDKKT